MSQYLEILHKWLQAHEATLGRLGLISVFMMAATLIAVPVIIIYLPPRYLKEEDGGEKAAHIPSPWRVPYLVVKNVLGAILAIAGVAMLVLPGQGLVTLAIGLGLMNFPGKRRLIHRLIGRPKMLETINRLRKRAHRPPLEAPEETPRTNEK